MKIYRFTLTVRKGGREYEQYWLTLASTAKVQRELKNDLRYGLNVRFTRSIDAAVRAVGRGHGHWTVIDVIE